jgi:NAD(P)-dependent dehydrogenase (short-subunit alcohol dehydrogenase family)
VGGRGLRWLGEEEVAEHLAVPDVGGSELTEACRARVLAAAPRSSASWRVIVNISTMVASFGMAGMALYGSTKAALELLTKAWAAEYGPRSVRVNAIAPGPTRTPGTEPMGEGLDQLASTLPLGRPANPTEIANAPLFLGSDEASYVNGAVLAVDGGRTAV